MLTFKKKKIWREINGYEGLYSITEKEASEIYQFAVIHENLYKGNNKDFRTQLNNLINEAINHH